MGLREDSLGRSTFRRGMLFNVGDMSAPQDSVKYLNNMLLDPINAISSRRGRSRKSSSIIGDVVYDTFRWLKSPGVSNYSNILAYKDGSEMKYATNDGATTTDLVTGLTDGNPVIAMQKKYRMYLSNCSDPTKVLVDDGGIQVRDVGLGDGPVPTLAEGGAGSPDGTYEYKVTVVYGEDGESNPGALDTITVSNKQIDVAWVAPTPPAGTSITSYNIWRKNPGTTLFKLVGSSSSSPFNDNVTDATVDGNEILEDNHNGPPDNLTGMVWWDYENVAIAWGENATVGSEVFPQRLFFSELARPEVWKTLVGTQDALNTAEFQDVPQESDDNPVIAVVPNGSVCYVFNRFGVRALTPIGTSRAYKVDIVANSSDHGIIGPRAVTVTDTGEIYYVSTDGVRMIRGRVEVEVNPNTDSASQGLVTRPGIGIVENSVNSIIHGISKDLRKYVYVHEYRDMVHISMGTDAVSGSSPSMNNDVLIYNISPPGFTYSAGRNVYGFTTVNDSGNDYQLWGSGYSVPESDSSISQGNYWREYDPGKSTDEDASGINRDISFTYADFNRIPNGLEEVKLDRFYADIASDTGVVSAKIALDNDRLVSNKQFTFQSTGQTAWQGVSYWRGDPANSLQNTATIDEYNSGAAYSNLVALFSVISDGEFRIVVNASNIDITGIDFSSVSSMDDVEDTINASLDLAGANVRCDYLMTPGIFRFSHDSTGSANSVTDILSVPAGVGTDLATAALLGTGANELVSNAADVQSPFTALNWAESGVEDLVNTWSSSGLSRNTPVKAKFHGERAKMISVSITSNTQMTVYGHRLKYQIVPPT